MASAELGVFVTAPYDMHPVSDDARALARALTEFCAGAGATWVWFDEQRAIVTVSTGDKDFFVSVDELSPDLQDTGPYEWRDKDHSMETLLALEQEQLAAYPATEDE